MNFFSDLFGALAFRESALRSLAGRRMFAAGIACFAAGQLAYDFVRNLVYADMPEIISRKRDFGRFEFCLDAVAVLLFTALVYIPLLLLFSRLIAGKGEPDFMFFRKYRIHAATLFSIWGLLFLITAPVQYVIPHFLIIDPFEISAGYLIRSILAAVHTVWAVKLLNALTGPQAFFVAMLSSISLPMLYLLI